MQEGNLLVEVLGKRKHFVGVLALVGVELDLGQHLVGERVRHYKRGVASSATQVHEAAFSQYDDVVAFDVVEVNLWLDLGLGVAVVGVEPRHVDLVVEVADVAHDSLVLHHAEVALGHDVLVSGRGAYDVGPRDGVVHLFHLIAVHSCLKGTDGVDFGHNHACSGSAERSRRALAHVAVSGNYHNLTGHHQVGGAAYRVNRRLFTAVLVVELRLGHRVVHVDGRQRKAAFDHALVQAVHAGGRLFRDSANAGNEFRVAVEHHVGEVATVVEDHVEGLLAFAKEQGLLNAPVKLFFSLAFPGIHADSGGGDGGRGVVLRREDVARRPSHFGTQLYEGFDKDRCLNRHVEAACHARSSEGLAGAELFAKGHQTGHFSLGEGNFFASPIGEGHILYFVGHVVRGSGRRHSNDYLEAQRYETSLGWSFQSWSSSPGSSIKLAILI